jgi:hypothetical protein
MNTFIEDLNKEVDDSAIDKRFAVGAVHGMGFGAFLSSSLLLCGAFIPAVWNWSSSVTKPAPSIVNAASVSTAPKLFEFATVYSNVPFIPLSYTAVRDGLNDANTRRLIERDMVSRVYFEEERLKGHTRYRPQLRASNDVHSVITLTYGAMKEVVVQLLNDDGSPGRYGLIPFEEYQDDISEGNK